MEKSFTVAELAEKIHASAIKGDPGKIVSGVNSLKLATETEASFFSNLKYAETMHASKAGVILVPQDFTEEAPEGKVLLVCEHPDRAFGTICALFAPPEPVYEMTISPLAYIAPTAKIGENVHIGPTAVIDDRAEIGSGCIIRAGAYIGPDCKVGDNTTIHPNVSIMRSCIIGKNVIIHAGTTIGSDGFGYTPSFRGLLKVPQNGIVQIDDNVEIGANCTIDRARFSKTWIKKGVKIDNLVHIAHNVIIGESSALIGQCGIAGSAVLGRGCAIGAQAGINGHIELGDGTKVIGPSAVEKGTNPGETVIGVPAEGERDYLERHMLPRRFKRLMDRVEKLEAQLKALTEEKK